MCMHTLYIHYVHTILYTCTLAVSDSLVVVNRVKCENVKKRPLSFGHFVHEQAVSGKRSHYRNIQNKFIKTLHVIQYSGNFRGRKLSWISQICCHSWKFSPQKWVWPTLHNIRSVVNPWKFSPRNLIHVFQGFVKVISLESLLLYGITLHVPTVFV